MNRQLSPVEREVLVAVLEQAEQGRQCPKPSTGDRELWLASVDKLIVDDACECGHCPSISLVNPALDPPAMDAQRVVLSAYVPGGYVTLFIDAGTPSYLELTLWDDEDIRSTFPAASELIFNH